MTGSGGSGTPFLSDCLVRVVLILKEIISRRNSLIYPMNHRLENITVNVSADKATKSILNRFQRLSRPSFSVGLGSPPLYPFKVKRGCLWRRIGRVSEA